MTSYFNPTQNEEFVGKFRGDKSKYEGWLFGLKNAIRWNGDRFDNHQRFVFLTNCLEGQPLQDVRYLRYDADSYQKALEILDNRYKKSFFEDVMGTLNDLIRLEHLDQDSRSGDVLSVGCKVRMLVATLKKHSKGDEIDPYLLPYCLLKSKVSIAVWRSFDITERAILEKNKPYPFEELYNALIKELDNNEKFLREDEEREMIFKRRKMSSHTPS